MKDKWIPNYILSTSGATHMDEGTRIRCLNFLRRQPDPEIIKIKKSKVTQFAVAVKFDGSTLGKGSTAFDKFYPQSHSCTIYKWNPNAPVHPFEEDKWDPVKGIHVPKKIYMYPKGAYYEWLMHKRSLQTKWLKIAKSGPENYYYTHRNRLVDAHLFFKTEKEFKKWVGEDNYAAMFADILE